MSVLLHMSDPHFGTELPSTVQALADLAQRIRPQRVILSGDITQRATAEEFAAAAVFVARLGAPVLAIPGNHDIPLYAVLQRLVAPYARHRAAFGNELEPEHLTPELMVLCVKTTRRWRHKNGTLSHAQIERVAARLASATPEQLRLVVVHQPIAVPREKDRHDKLRHADAAAARWAAAGADCVLGGHIHLPYVMPLDGLTRPLWAVQAGTALSARVRGRVPNSVNVLRWGGGDAPAGRCTVERWDCAVGSGVFVLQGSTELTPQRASALAEPSGSGSG